MLITNGILVKDPTQDFFYAIDSIKFWNNSIKVTSISDLFNQFTMSNGIWGGTEEYRLFNFISLVIAYLAGLVGENHIVIQKMQGVFLGALSIPMIFLILNKYTNFKFSSEKAILFSICSFVSTFAVVFSRDIHVYFIYTLATFLIIFHREKPRVLIYLCLLCPITYYIRFEHGIFYSIFIFAYLYLTRKENKYVLLLATVISPVILYFAFIFLSRGLQTYSTYSDKRLDAAGDTDSLAITFQGLPFGIKHLFLMFIGQTAPTPFWRNLVYQGTDLTQVSSKSHHWLRFMESLSGGFWIVVWGILIYSVIKGYFKKISVELQALFFISIILLFVTTADIQVRGIFAVYPIIFCVSMVMYFHLKPTEKRIAVTRSIAFLIFINLFYFLLKS